jgi:hypothetical protein
VLDRQNLQIQLPAGSLRSISGPPSLDSSIATSEQKTPTFSFQLLQIARRWPGQAFRRIRCHHATRYVHGLGILEFPNFVWHENAPEVNFETPPSASSWLRDHYSPLIYIFFSAPGFGRSPPYTENSRSVLLHASQGHLRA